MTSNVGGFLHGPRQSYPGSGGYGVVRPLQLGRIPMRNAHKSFDLWKAACSSIMNSGQTRGFEMAFASTSLKGLIASPSDLKQECTPPRQPSANGMRSMPKPRAWCSFRSARRRAYSVSRTSVPRLTSTSGSSTTQIVGPQLPLVFRGFRSFSEPNSPSLPIAHTGLSAAWFPIRFLIGSQK